MRTPPAALHRRRAHRLHSEGRAHPRVVKAGAHRRRLFAPPAGARAIDHSDRRTALSRRSAAERRDGGDRSAPSLYDDAWSEKGRRDDHHLGGARRLQKRRTHTHRSHVVFDREQARLSGEWGVGSGVEYLYLSLPKFLREVSILFRPPSDEEN